MQNLVLLTILSCLVLGFSHPLTSLCDPHDEFKCADGTCIAIERQCDNLPDCSKGDDEDDCHYLHVCDPGLFMCHSGECLDAKARCNGVSDCLDRSDELGCSKSSSGAPAVSTPRSLQTNGNRQLIAPALARSSLSSVCNPTDEFQCADERCIPIERQCDNIHDCSRGEDELDCNYLHKCEPGLFMCHSGECLRAATRCNGVSDCLDSSDENGCPKSSSDALTVTTPKPFDMYGNRKSDVWVVLFLISLFVIIFGAFMFFLCNRYPQVRYRRDLVVDRVASAIKNSSPIASLKSSSLLTPKQEEKKPMVSVVNPVFS